MRVIPSAFFRVGEDLVGVDELLELSGGIGLAQAGFDKLVWVALESELFVSRPDFVGRRRVLGKSQHLVQASLLRCHSCISGVFS